MNVRRPPDYADPVAEAQRVVDRAEYRQRILDLLPDEALEHIAVLASDDAVAAAYRELERRRCA